MSYDPRDDAFKSYEAAIDALRAKHLNARKVVRIGECELILGDCLEVMPGLGSVSHAVTDPPYEKEAHTPTRRTHSSIKSGIAAELDFGAITESQRLAIPAHFKGMVEGWSIMFCQVEGVPLWRDAIETASGKYKRAMAWVKPDASPQFNGQGPAQGYECAVAAWWGSGHSSWNAGGKRGVYTHCVNQATREGTHPTEKPISLMREIVTDFTSAGETILDPFMGSGTTGVACVQLQRSFIGIELDETYFDIACKRIEEAYKQPSLFPAEKPKPAKTADLFEEDAA